jgi:hypothetical protein
VRPSAAEACNGIDDDCDASIDDGLTIYTSYADGDGDGYGAGAAHNGLRSAVGIRGDIERLRRQRRKRASGRIRDLQRRCRLRLRRESGRQLRTLVGERDLVDGDWNITGNDASDGLGTWVDIGGDLDGDGSDDILALAPSARTTVGSVTYDEGAAYVFFGPTGGPSANASDASLTYLAAGSDALDLGVALAKDVDGDGYDDLLVGAPGYDSTDGVVDLAFGPFASGDLLTSTSAAMEKLDSSELYARVGK